MDVAKAQIEKNRTDFCMANDYATVVSPVHVGFIVDRNGHEIRYDGKEAIARGVVENVMKVRR